MILSIGSPADARQSFPPRGTGGCRVAGARDFGDRHTTTAVRSAFDTCRAIAIGEGNPVVLVSSPFSVVVYLVALLAIILPPLILRVRGRRTDRTEVSVW